MRKRRIGGECEWLSGLRPMGFGPWARTSGEQSTRQPASRRTALPSRDLRFGGGGGLRPRSSSHHRLEEFGRPARLRFLRRGTPFSPCAGAALRFGPLGLPREPHGASRFQALMSFGAVLEGPSGSSGDGLPVGAGPRGPPRPGKALQARAVGPAFPPAPEAGAEGLGCWFVRTRRAGTRSRKGPPALLRPAPYRQVWRHSRRRLGGSPARISRAESATAHEASGRALPRVRSSGHPPPAPGASFCC